MNAKTKTKKKQRKKERKDSSIWFISKVKIVTISTYAKNHVSMPISSRYLAN